MGTQCVVGSALWLSVMDGPAMNKPWPAVCYAWALACNGAVGVRAQLLFGHVGQHNDNPRVRPYYGTSGQVPAGLP